LKVHVKSYTGFEPQHDLVLGSSDGLYDKKTRALNNCVKAKNTT